MILIRRLLTIPLVLLFLALFLLTLILLRVNETFLEPVFYKEQLAKAGIYDFVLDDLPTTAMDELRGKGPGFFRDDLKENPLVTLSLSTEEVVSAIHTSLPAPWVQEQVEQVIDQAGGYITGEQDSFEITIEAADRVTTAKEELKSLIVKAEVYALLFDEIIAAEVDKALENEGALPLGVSVTSDDLIAAIERVAPETWLEEQVNLALDEVVAYTVGDQDSFRVNVQLSDRADVALEEVKAILRRSSYYDLLFEQVVDPMLSGSLSLLTRLPFGVDISKEEVLSALHQVAPSDWVQEQVEIIIDEASPYLTGKTDTFQVAIPLAERREVTLTVIEDLARTRLEDLVQSLPACALGQLPFSGGVPSLNALPVCIPFGVDVLSLLDSLDIDVFSSVREMIGAQIPDQMTYTEADLRRLLVAASGKDALGTLDKVRGTVRDGWTYTDTDLRRDLSNGQGEGGVEVLDGVRAALSGGWTYTEVDLRQDMLDAGQESVWNNLGTFRSGLSAARDYQYLVFVLWGLLLLVIGYLGGRHWWSKFAWAAVVLAISSAIVFAAAGPVFNIASERFASEVRAESFREMEGTRLLLADKGLDVLLTVSGDFLSGIRDSSLVLLVAAAVLFVLARVWGALFDHKSPRRT